MGDTLQVKVIVTRADGKKSDHFYEITRTTTAHELKDWISADTRLSPFKFTLSLRSTSIRDNEHIWPLVEKNALPIHCSVGRGTINQHTGGNVGGKPRNEEGYIE